MKKYILGTLFTLCLLISPVFTPPAEAAALAATQISAIIELLQAFGADQSVINNVQTTLNGGAVVAGPIAADTSAPQVNLVTSVSNSASGPFITNGTVVNNLPVYARIVSAGVNMKSSSPKGCIQPAGQTGCSSDLGYRDYIPSEWLDNSTIQTIVQDPSVYPLTTYELYIKFPGGSPIKAGTLKLVAPSAVTLTSRPQIDVFLVAGQSNALQSQSSNFSPTSRILSYVENLLTLKPNVGAWPSFGSTYDSSTGKSVVFVISAMGGTGQTVAADSGNGNWDVQGTLLDRSTKMLDSAMKDLVTAGYNPTFKGVLWSQGENDSIQINAKIITGTDYKNAFSTMISRYRTHFGSTMPFYIFQTGTEPTESDYGYATVRNIQAQVPPTDSNSFLVFNGAVGFPSRGLMNGLYHYSQSGYDEMGTVGAQNVLAQRSITETTPNPNVSTIPSAPTLTTDETSGLPSDSFTLKWGGSTNNPTEYRMIITGSFNSGDRLSQANRTSFTSSLSAFGLGAGTYNFTIRACNASGCSRDSKVVTYVATTVHLTSLSPSGGKAGTTITINGSGFTGNNNIYLNGSPVDTLNSTPTWISFVIPSNLPSCPGWDRFCVPGPVLTPGTYTVGVQNTNGTSNTVSLGVN